MTTDPMGPQDSFMRLWQNYCDLKEKAAQLRSTNENLRATLADPPGDVQELVLRKLGLWPPPAPKPVQTEVCPVCRTVHDRPLCPAPTAQAPIARSMVAEGFVSWTHLYAPGLPDGIHDLYCEPPAPGGQKLPHPCFDPLELAATAASYHGLMPQTDVERAYMRGREDAAADIRTLKGTAPETHDEHCDVNDPIIKGKPCNCRHRVPVETGAELSELLTVARDLLPDPDFEPSEDREIKLRSIRDRIDRYLARPSQVKTKAESVSLDYKLPCEVRLPPSTSFGRGVTLRTLMYGLRFREGHPDEYTKFDDERSRAVALAIEHANATNDGPCTSCNDTGWDSALEKPCDCAAGDQHRDSSPDVNGEGK